MIMDQISSLQPLINHLLYNLVLVPTQLFCFTVTATPVHALYFKASSLAHSLWQMTHLSMCCSSHNFCFPSLHFWQKSISV